MANAKILIVEDEPLIASGIECCLTELDYECIGIASTGTEAIKLAYTLKPNLILMDINIPEIDGIIVMERLNRIAPMPCIFITGYSDQELIQRAASVNAFGYLMKPVDIHDLEAAIKIALTRSEESRKKEVALAKSKQALEERIVIERAKGILMDIFEMKEGQAMEFLQKKSRNSNRKIAAVAQEIIDAGTRFNA